MAVFGLACLGCAVVGLGMLWYANQMEIPHTFIGTLTTKNTGERVVLCGNVTNVRVSRGHQFLSLHDLSGSITVVAFNSSGAPAFNRNQSLCVSGRVQVYPPQSTSLELIYERNISL